MRTLLLALLSIAAAQAQGALKTINPPQGGKIVYGQVEGQTTEAGAMGAILRSIHTEYADRPQVGKLFQVRGTQSVAAFFSVNKKNQGSGQLTGLLIVTKVTTDHVQAGVITDDASRFASNLNPSMKALFSAWHPFDAVRAEGSGSSAAVPRLHKFVLSDGSASVELPDGWKVQPSSAAGTIIAEGSNGESASLGLTFLVHDLNNPAARQTYATVMRGGLRNTSYANALYYRTTGDLSQTFVDIIQMNRHRANLAPAALQIAGADGVPAPPSERCAHITGHMDAKDGKGMKEMNTVFCATAPTPAAGIFLAIFDHTLVPNQLADKERATIGAILASFSVDTAAVQRMANAYAAPAIQAIHEIGKAAAAQAEAAHRSNEIHNSSVYQRWDDNDKRSKEFSNYQLGYSVILDNANNAHGTFWNEDADALVRHDPQRFEYVSAPNFWKGIDY